MDDDLDDAPRSWRKKSKDSFQNELQSKLRQRRYQGKSVDISDSDDNDPSNLLEMGGAKRPTDHRRRRHQTSDLSHGLGTQTLRAKDLSRMLNHNLSDDDDDDDEEIIAANLGRSASGESLHSSGLKTPSPKQESKYLRKTASKDHSENAGVFGRRTPGKETSPHSSLSKEDGIFGRKTPTITSKEDRSITFNENEHGDEQWQPPKYRNVSPKDREQSRGSRGVSPIDSSLERISESIEGKVTKQILRGQQEEAEELFSHIDKPKPQIRSKVGNRKTSPHAEQQRKSPSSQEVAGSMKRSTPTLDIFGQSRSAAAHELEEYMESNNDKETKDRKTPTSRAHTPELKRGAGLLHKTPEKPGVKFAIDDKKSQTGRKTPTDSQERKSPVEKKSSEKSTASTAHESSLLDFLKEDNIAATPKPQARGRHSKGIEHTDFLDDIFGNNRKITSNEDKTSPGAVGRKTAGPTGRKTPEHARKSPVTSDKQENIFQTIAKLEQTEDTSSICEDIPPDPNRKLANQESKNQTTERALADNVIETVALTQTLKYTEPAKKMRPKTASAKVQHRPKPRYGDQLNKTSKSLQEHQFNSTGDIRDAIYEEWYKVHLHLARQKKKDEEKKAKEEEEKKKKEAENKLQEAELSYKAWMEQKKKILQEEYKEKEKKERLAKEKVEQDKKEQKDKSQKVFDTWKGQKDAVIKKELQRKNEETKKVEREKKQKLLEKQKDRESAHKTWVNKKERHHVAQIEQKKKEEKNKRSFEEDSKEELQKKEKSAENIYHEWIEKKENQARLEKVKARRKLEDDEGKPAWSPANRTIPFGR